MLERPASVACARARYANQHCSLAAVIIFCRRESCPYRPIQRAALGKIQGAMSDRSIKSAERTLALFELFSAAERPLAVNEVVHALGIPQSSATMLLQNMAALGYLEYLPELRKYKPSIRLFLLNCWVLRRFGEAADFMEAFNALHEMAGEIM
ncbi:MAG: helix-turn-helix domain-containing protein, partial [Hyphomonadaceae bacterium]